MTADVCGTAAGHSAHYRRGEPTCPECRAAQAAYKRQWRKDPAKRQRENLATTANQRALWRLAELYRADFERLNDEERVALGLAPIDREVNR